MVSELVEAVNQVGLELHVGKCEALKKQYRKPSDTLQVGSREIAIVHSIVYLVRVIPFENTYMEARSITELAKLGRNCYPFGSSADPIKKKTLGFGLTRFC